MDLLKSIEKLYKSSEQTIKDNQGSIFISNFGELDSEKISEICETAY
jgi:hypothetical protein